MQTNTTKKATLLNVNDAGTLSKKTAKKSKHTIIYGDNGNVLLKIKHSQAYDLANQLSAMFQYKKADLVSKKHFLMHMLSNAIDSGNIEGGEASIYVSNVKEWIETLEILHTVSRHTHKVKI